ncbi:hypothetical protein Tco_1315471 [Tanacetum coccineum]
MDDPDITMEEYIQLMADKARGRDQTFNWETATYGEVYCEDLDSFTDFETNFLAIVYNDASTSNQNVSSEPTEQYGDLAETMLWYQIFTKGQKRSQNGQNQARNGKSVKSQSQPDKVKIKDGADIEEILNGSTRIQVNGPGQPIYPLS